MTQPLRFDFIPYPLWRRKSIPPLARPLLRPFSALDADAQPPATPSALAHYLTRWRLIPPGLDAAAARRQLENLDPPVETVADQPPTFASAQPLRLPAQWEPLEAVILTFPVLYPPLWTTHLAMIEAISPVARVDVLIPAPEWARAIWLWLITRERATLANVRLLHLPTDDIWVRDYGPLVGLNANGEQIAVSAIYDPLATYPQARDNAMPERWAAHQQLPVRPLDLHTEGGNFWSDGAGTLLMSDELFQRHADLSREEVLRRLHEVFQFDRLITTPSLWREETGHVDLLVKLADAQTALVGAPTPLNGDRLRAAADTLRDAGYRVVPLPMPPPYLNWLVYPVWRSYTNALTVNGRVLVPTFGIASDAEALAIYRDAMPDHEVIGIDCRAAANGGGAVHCLTKEIPAAQARPEL